MKVKNDTNDSDILCYVVVYDITSGALCGRKDGSSLNQLELISAQKYGKLKT